MEHELHELTLVGLAPLHCGPLQKRPCDFAPWGEWGECSATCDGGMRERSRHIKTPNSNDGVRSHAGTTFVFDTL